MNLNLHPDWFRRRLDQSEDRDRGSIEADYTVIDIPPHSFRTKSKLALMNFQVRFCAQHTVNQIQTYQQGC